MKKQNKNVPLLTKANYDLYKQNPGIQFVWKANPGACFKCQSLHNKHFTLNELEQIGRPHPNCLCRVVAALPTYESFPAPIFPWHEPGPISGPILPWNVPPEVDLKQNIKEAHSMSWWDFFQSVKNKGKWDYKQLAKMFEKFGNFNYAVTGRAAGFSTEVLLRAAGIAQRLAGTSRPEWGTPFDLSASSSYGDDPEDQRMIRQGSAFFDMLNK
jgi:hypothetical protein